MSSKTLKPDCSIEPLWFGSWFNELFPEETLSPRDIHSRLEVPKDRIYRAINYGCLEAFRGTGRWIVPRPALREWLLESYNLNS